MPENTAKLAHDGGEPEVEIQIGDIQRGDHLIVLFDKDGNNGMLVGKSANGVPVAIRYPMPRPLSTLDGSLLRWNCIVGTSTDDVETASVTVRVIQDGQVVDGGQVTTEKQVDALDVIKDQMRLALV